jgi:hypothetical protein
VGRARGGCLVAVTTPHGELARDARFRDRLRRGPVAADGPRLTGFHHARTATGPAGAVADHETGRFAGMVSFLSPEQVFPPSFDDRVTAVAVDRRTGHQVWTLSGSAPGGGTPVLLTDGTRLHVVLGKSIRAPRSRESAEERPAVTIAG